MQHNRSFLQICQPWWIWILAAGTFFSVYIVRISPLAMVPELITRYNASSTGIGTLGFYFLLSYVGMQIPVGMLIDRFGARLTITLATGVCALSTYLFAVAEVLWLAQIARFLLGFSAAFAFVNALKLAAYWFTPRIFSILVGASQALGMLGAAAGASITSRLVKAQGVESSLLYFAIGLATLTVLLGIFIRNKPRVSEQTTVELSTRNMNLNETVSVSKALKIILSDHKTWIVSLTTGLLYLPTGVFGELWGSFYLSEVYHLPSTVANDAIGIFFIGWAIGGPLAGALSNLIGRRATLMLTAFSGLILIPIILYLPVSAFSIFLIYSLLFAFGVFNSGAIAGYTIVAELHPKNISGTALGFANGMSVIVAMACQPLIGIILDYLKSTHASQTLASSHSASDLKLAMAVIVVGSVLACIGAYFSTETQPRP